jgi:hypothetical protein
MDGSYAVWASIIMVVMVAAFLFFVEEGHNRENRDHEDDR